METNPIVFVRWYGRILQGELLEGDHLGMKQVRIPLDGHHPVALFSPGHVYDSPDQVTEESSTNCRKTAEISANTSKIEQKQAHLVEINVWPSDKFNEVEAFKQANWDHERNHLRTDCLDEFYRLWRDSHDGYLAGVDPAQPGGDWSSVTLPSHTAKHVAETTVPKSGTTHNTSQSHKPVKKMRCWKCAYRDYDCINGCQEQPQPGEHFCGLHGRARVDPDGLQIDLDHMGGCGFAPRKETVQLELFN